MPDPSTPFVPKRRAGLGLFSPVAWLPLTMASVGSAAVVLAFAWWGPPALAGAALVVAGGVVGGWLVRHQVRHSVGALLAGPLASDGHRLVPPTDADPVRSGSAVAREGLASPLLEPLADRLQQLQARQEALATAQAGQLESLRQQAHTDALTGLPNRRHFMATLDAFLAGEGISAESGLLLVRVCDLQGMNQRIGHIAADHVLQALAQSLQAYPARIERCFAGRLNGADFALMLPVGGLAAETAQALVLALRGPIQRIDPRAMVAAGGAELRAPLSANQALALADAALAKAETSGGLATASADDPSTGSEPAPPAGESSWQRRIARALVQGRVALGAFEVRAADGRQLHLDCPLRVQLVPDGPLEPAARWLSLATRSRLCAAADEKALALALDAIARDGVARCVNVAVQSAGSAEFVAAVSSRLEAEPALACRLWIDLPEALALDRPQLVRELSRRWRPLGVMMGLEHAGESLARIPRLMDLGLDCVRIDSRFVNGIAAADAHDARRYLQGLVALVQSMGLQVTAEGVRSADDLDLLWGMGFDAATGPVLAAETAVAG